MKCKKMPIVLTIPLLCGVLFTVCSASAVGKRVYDEGKLFSGLEETSLEEEIARFQDDTGMDFVVLTNTLPHGNVSAEAIADDFYDEHGFGLDEEHSGALYYIDMSDRYHHLSTTGRMIDIMTDERIQSAIDACRPALSAGNYGSAALTMLDELRLYHNAGIPEGQYRYDVLTGRRITARHKALTSGELALSLAGGLVVAVVFVAVVTRRYKLKGSTYQYAYRQNCDMDLLEKEDQFLRTTTTQVRKADSSGSSGGGSGGSGVHTGSSGTSHGGGGGRF